MESRLHTGIHRLQRLQALYPGLARVVLHFFHGTLQLLDDLENRWPVLGLVREAFLDHLRQGLFCLATACCIPIFRIDISRYPINQTLSKRLRLHPCLGGNMGRLPREDGQHVVAKRKHIHSIGNSVISVFFRCSPRASKDWEEWERKSEIWLDNHRRHNVIGINVSPRPTPFRC